MSKIISISKKSYYNSTNFQNNNKFLNKISSNSQRINKTQNNYNIHDKNTINKNIIKKKIFPSYKFPPSENQEFYTTNDGNVEYIIYDDEQGDLDENIYKKNIHTHQNNIKLVKINNYRENIKQSCRDNKICEEYYSNEILNTQPNTRKKIVKYLSPESEREKLKKIRYFNKDDYLYQRVNINNSFNKINQNLCNNKNINNITTINTSFKDIKNFSNKNRYNINYYNKNNSSEKNQNKYFYKSELHIINDKDENKRSFSNDYKYMKNQNSKRNTKTKLFLFKRNRDYMKEEYNFMKSKSFDEKNLKIQNSQNVQIINEDRLYQILLPIRPNEIDYTCKFQIPKDNDRNKHNQINIKKEELNIIANETEKKINQNKKYIKKTINKKFNNKFKNEQINIDDKINIKDFSIENFNLNIQESGRKFKEELSIVKPKNEPSFTIEKIKPKEKILYEQNNAKLYYKGNPKINSDLIINRQNMENIKKFKDNNLKYSSLFIQKNDFHINGISKSWNGLLKNNKGDDVILKAKNKNDNKNNNKNNIQKEEISDYYEINFINEKIIYSSSEPEIELNSFNLTENNTNETYMYSFRESLTNKEINKNKKIENENEYDELTEGTTKSELFQSFAPKSTLRKKYREQINCVIPKLNENIENQIFVEENEAFLNKSNGINSSLNKKSHVQYVHKNNFNKNNKNSYEYEKSKTFIKQMDFEDVKPIVKIQTEYDVKFPEADILNQFQNESRNSSLNENLNSLKENFSNINNYNSFNIKHNNNIIMQGISEGN